MPKVSKINLRQLFSKGAKPAQEAFYNWLDSFWHKDEQIDLNAVKGLQTSLDKKLDVAAQDTILNAFNSFKTEVTETVKTGYLAYLKKSDITPVGGWKVGLYKLIEIGNYTNLTPAKNEAGNAITITAVDQKINEAYWNGSFWSKSEISIPGTTAKQTFDPNDNVSPAAMKATEIYFNDNFSKFLQKEINNVISSNQTEIISYGKDTSFVKVATNTTLWLGNKIDHKVGVLKSLTINALKAVEFKFGVITYVNDTTITIGPYFSIYPQIGIKEYQVPANITLQANQGLALSCNVSGMMGYTDGLGPGTFEMLEFSTTSNVNHYPGYIPIIMNLEVPKGKTPFTVPQMMLSIYDNINGGGNEYEDFSTVVNLDRTKEVKYTKLPGLTEFTKGVLMKDKVVTYKLTGGSIIFSSDFWPTKNSEDYNPNKTNIISFYKQFNTIRYFNETKNLEPI